jgi:hypothetical protein
MKTTAGAPISADMRVSEILRTRPGACDVLRANGCPDMRSGLFSLMARIMKLRWAARVRPPAGEAARRARGVAGRRQGVGRAPAVSCGSSKRSTAAELAVPTAAGAGASPMDASINLPRERSASVVGYLREERASSSIAARASRDLAPPPLNSFR